MNTLYWHDYETWGEVPSRDRPCQFAGIRTDESLDVIGEPLMIFSQPMADTLPNPEACLVTGLTPQKAAEEGMPEPEFIARIHRELAEPGTCGVGYNSLRFDDEVTRYALYRNFFDPYGREWRDNNSRWDIIDMVRMMRALRPDGIVWPARADGTPSLRLEDLTAANGIAHEGAHDALSDVMATIELARLVRERQPKLYDYLYGLRRKQAVMALIDVQNCKPLLHVSSRFPVANGNTALVAPLALHPVNRNAVIVCNLCEDPAPLLELSPEVIAKRLYTRTEDLADDESRIPLKLIHMNKSPALATAKLLDESTADRLEIDRGVCERNWQQLRAHDLREKLAEVYRLSELPPERDPEQQLYQGFISDGDRRRGDQLRGDPETLLANDGFGFDDARLNTLLFRYKARHFPHLLTDQERTDWQTWRWQRLTDPDAGAGLTVDECLQRIEVLSASGDLSEAQLTILDSLGEYAVELLEE